MTSDDHWAAERAKRIARETLDGNYDLLLACRELADLRERLPSIPEAVMDIFVGVDSEADGLPIGSERQYWAPDALQLKDRQAANYRERVRGVVTDALQTLLGALSD